MALIAARISDGQNLIVSFHKLVRSSVKTGIIIGNNRGIIAKRSYRRE